MHFVETPVFTKLVHQYLTDADYRAIQLALMLRPQHGALIRGSGGLRKIRWRAAGTGKRGGVRVIYHWDPATATFYCLFAYRKNVQGDLTQEQIRALRRMVEENFG
ncbi:MAG TPA: hypothetical protein VG916_01755 [Gemmatimonadaceae bacterium]|nr:hypothetical protein [Gemmatimonadaceae bacterium]